MRFSTVYGPVAKTTSGVDGVFHVDLPDGVYTIEVQASGFAAIVLDDVVVAAGEATARDVTLEPSSAIEVTTGLVVVRSAAYDFVWHSEGRDALGWDDVDRPPLVEAEDLAAALAETRNVDERDRYGDTALMFLATGDVEQLVRLLKAGADPNAVDMYGATPGSCEPRSTTTCRS